MSLVLDGSEALAWFFEIETDGFAGSITPEPAERFRLPNRDAARLELTKRRVRPLASLEQALRNAASAMNLLLVGIAA